MKSFNSNKEKEPYPLLRKETIVLIKRKFKEVDSTDEQSMVTS